MYYFVARNKKNALCKRNRYKWFLIPHLVKIGRTVIRTPLTKTNFTTLLKTLIKAERKVMLKNKMAAVAVGNRLEVFFCVCVKIETC